MVDQEKIKESIHELFDNIPYHYYPDSRCDVYMKRINSKNFVALNCNDTIYDDMSFEELVIRYKFMFERFLSETDTYKMGVLEDELGIIKEYMYKCLLKEQESP